LTRISEYEEDFVVKRISFYFFLILIASFVLTLSACHKKPKPEPMEPTKSSSEAPVEQAPQQPQQSQEGTGAQVMNLAEITGKLQPVFYDYNKSDIRDDQVAALQNNAAVLKQNPQANVLIEGHCDERGTEEYNQALGDRRATAAKDYLVSLGIAENRVRTISYGETRPFAQGHNEDAWRQNRRAQFVAVSKQ
jgi:peptidoglycan-associated lipoprotein